jgi:predicted acetyltransferase
MTKRMAIEYRPITRDEMEVFQTANSRAFSYHRRPVPEGETPSWEKYFEYDRSIAAWDGNEIVGTSVVFSFEMTVPGAILPTGGVSWIGVQATHRRQGILTEFMRRELDDCRRRGEHIAALWASESVIYGRFGYGMAVPHEEWEIERVRSTFKEPVNANGQLRYLDRDALLPLASEVWEATRQDRPGLVKRDTGWWERVLAIGFTFRREDKETFYLVYEEGGNALGYALYRVENKWESGLPRSVLTVVELVGVTPEAEAALWRFCFDVDLIDSIKAEARPVDDHIPWRLQDYRRLTRRQMDGYWVRIVDVMGALAGRRYGVEDRLIVEMKDDFCPWNEGVYDVDGGPNGAGSHRVSESPQLTMSAADLGAIYMGGVDVGALVRAGRIVEHKAGSARRAQAMFGWTPRPWAAHHF